MGSMSGCIGRMLFMLNERFGGGGRSGGLGGRGVDGGGGGLDGVEIPTWKLGLEFGAAASTVSPVPEGHVPRLWTAAY